MVNIPNTVDEYLSLLPMEVKSSLEKLRKAIITAAPEAEEKISYRIPFYRLNGHLAAFVAHKKHNSFVTMSRKVIKSFKDQLKPYEISGTTIHFPHNKALPSSLVKEIIKARILENKRKSIKRINQKTNN
ncbi:MAG: DUF1801 domain-containing protein [Ignavibacteria bacterium]|nr:DUF1801 domain-containing protein [Ignavibacteria bacterium]